jgi:predicted Zn-dependent peptidase
MNRNDNRTDGATNDAPESNGRSAARLRRAVEAATAGKGSHDELQMAARALVAELRERHDRPEQVLVQIKNLLADAGLQAGYPARDETVSHNAHTRIYRDIITWSIRYYYENPNAGDGDAP